MIERRRQPRYPSETAVGRSIASAEMVVHNAEQRRQIAAAQIERVDVVVRRLRVCVEEYDSRHNKRRFSF
jgi:hypothetical protein